MNKVIIACATALFLVGCSETGNIIQQQYVVVQIPVEYFNACPAVSKLPDPKTLRDIQVARALVSSYQGHRKCKAAVDAIQRYMDEAEKQFKTETPEVSASFETAGAV